MLQAAEIVPRAVQSSSGACLIHIYAMQSNPETRRDEMRIPAYPASCLAAESTPECLYSHKYRNALLWRETNLLFCSFNYSEREEKLSSWSLQKFCIIIIDAFTPDCILCSLARLRVRTRICLSISARQEGRSSTQSAEKAQQLCCQLAVARHHSMSLWICC